MLLRGARFEQWGSLALVALVAACTQSPGTTTDATTGNRAPTISGAPPTTATQGLAYSFTPTASDPDGDALTFGIDAKPSWGVFDTSTGRLSGAPGASDVGVARGIVIWVSDGHGQTALPAFDLTVSAQPVTNHPPTISGTPPTALVAGATYSFAPTASDADGDTLTFTIRNKPAWATFSVTTGQLQGVPQLADVGTFADIGITVSDGQATVALPAFGIVVTAPAINRAPVISGSPMTSVAAGQPYAFVPSASDPDGDPLTFSVTGLPAWAAFDPATGRLAGTPTAAGTFASIVIGVSDGKAVAALPAFAITVSAPITNRAPTISGTPPASAPQGVQYAFQPSASDPDGDPLTFTIANAPAWATFSATTGRLQGTPGAVNAGTYANIVVSVSDGKASAALPAFSITVANAAPTISGSPATTGNVGTLYTFTPTASDTDTGTTLTFSVANKPAWATFSTTTGQLQGTPTAAGTSASIAISVSDGQATASLPAFSIAVSQPNRPPTISGTPATTATQAVAYSFTPTASDPDGDTLTFSVANKPAWTTFSASTGQLQGTPSAADTGTYGNITISVSDGKAPSVALAAFAIGVANAPPTISGSAPTTGSVGTLYTFTPTASDPDAGTTLTFSVANKPAWATFSTTTGQLQGTPTAAGTSANIAISVSDGQASASLPAFSIAVTQPNRAPTISGTPATTATTGTAYSFTPTASDPDGDTL